ncbi:hypothetical protein [Kitasatospora camelliae]|uniref:Uncharacterized protein n=1 Tax=Kitasatospora camelliae TaxID=3156397 RepID=A0AAU8K2P7_9ACTN
MKPYAGPATVTTPDGATIPVTAHLSTRPSNRDDWAGLLTADDGVALLNVHEGRLLLPDGREAGFVRTAGGVPGGPIQIAGASGEALL